MHSVSTLPHLYARSHAERWRVPRERFAVALERSLASGFRGSPPTKREVSRYLDSLHLEDLALACACAAGTNEAWEHFIATHRPALYRAASAIAGERGRELADSLYGDLFGLEERGGNRRSLLEYFHGRSSLATWVRAILAQRFIDTVRASRRTEPLDERVSDEATTVIDAESPDLDRARLTRLLTRSFGAAPGRPRASRPGPSLVLLSRPPDARRHRSPRAHTRDHGFSQTRPHQADPSGGH